MAQIKGFLASGEYYDDKHFPRGFKRSGDFSIPEADILSQLGSRLAALEAQKATPETEEENHFATMCLQDLLPESQVERVWAKYKNLINTGKPKFTLHSRAEDVEDDPSLLDDDI